MSIRRACYAVGATALLGGAIATSVLPASAGTQNTVGASSGADCDPAVGQWDVRWSISNESDRAATITDVQATPGASPITGLPASLAGGSRVEGTQRIPGLTARLSFTVTWDNGTSAEKTVDFASPTPCTKVTLHPTPRWKAIKGTELYDAGIIQFDPTFVRACDFKADHADISFDYVTIDGRKATRISVPQGGCAVSPNLEGLRITAVTAYSRDRITETVNTFTVG
jgi:hypothetical protein